MGTGKNELLDGSFDIVCLSETWLHANITDSMVTAPLYIIRVDRAVLVKDARGNLRSRRGGGVCIYTKLSYSIYKHK